MVQEKQLKELFKYIEANWDVCVSQVDKTDIKRIFGGVLCDDIMNDTDQVTDQEPDQVAEPTEQPALNPIVEAYHNYEPIRYKKWEKFQWIKKHSEFEAKTENGAIFNVVSLSFNTHPQLWEIYTEPTEKASSQAKLDNSSMTYEEAVKHIISNKLTHKKAGSDSWFAYKFFGYNIHFCDENGKDMIAVSFFKELDLTEWYPYKKPFDRERFERMFRAVVASGRTERWEQDFKFTEEALAKLDAYYAEKEGGANE